MTQTHRMSDPVCLFVGHLPLDGVHEQELRKVFEAYGRVVSVRRRQSFGFVTFANHKDAQLAKQRAHGKVLGGQAITVEWSKEKNPDKPKRDRIPYERPNNGQTPVSRTPHVDCQIVWHSK